MTPALAIPPVTNEDKLPDHQAVWREGEPAIPVPAGVQVSVDHGDGLIEQARYGGVRWPVGRWRWGWGPA
jgi:hypothetical protein